MSHILFVEPDRQLANTYLHAARTAGYTAQVCPTAQGAILCADDATPDVVVLELQLVAHSGIEFLYEFRSYCDWQNIPVVVLSHVPPEEFTESWELLRDHLKVSAYHYKPRTSLRTLLRTIGDVTAPQLV
ncbi:MAG TPA: hypothetical protein VHD60_00810 [Candidatus Saccharimonadales bacterium]|nr:hypothetical protein [Candidatus Saccharimonadales bacterium]